MSHTILIISIDIITDLSKDLQAMSALVLYQLDPRSQVSTQGQEPLAFASCSNSNPHYNLIHRLHSLVLIAIWLKLPTRHEFHSFISNRTLVILRHRIRAENSRIAHIRVEGAERDRQNADVEWCYFFGQDFRHTYISFQPLIQLESPAWLGKVEIERIKPTIHLPSSAALAGA